MTPTPGRYSPTRAGFVPRIVTAVSGHTVTFHPEGQERSIPVPADEWAVWVEITGATNPSPAVPGTAQDIERMEPIEVAKVCHEANRAICEAAGDHSQKPWADAEVWQRDSALTGVMFARNNPDAHAAAQHDAWMADKIAAGWVHGEVKDAEAKTHPCIVPYDELPFDQRVKDHVFRAIVSALS